MVAVHGPRGPDVRAVAEKALIARDVFGNRLAHVVAPPGGGVELLGWRSGLTAEDAEGAEEKNRKAK